MRYFDQAAVFTECCLEYGLITRNKDSGTKENKRTFCSNRPVSIFCCFIIHVAPLIEAVFLEYARLLESLGLSRGMRYYCNLAGGKGTMLLEEHFSPQKRDIP